MRHIDQVESFYIVRTNKGIRFYECFSLSTVFDMAAQDDLLITEILGVYHNLDDIDMALISWRKDK